VGAGNSERYFWREARFMRRMPRRASRRFSTRASTDGRNPFRDVGRQRSDNVVRLRLEIGQRSRGAGRRSQTKLSKTGRPLFKRGAVVTGSSVVVFNGGLDARPWPQAHAIECGSNDGSSHEVSACLAHVPLERAVARRKFHVPWARKTFEDRDPIPFIDLEVARPSAKMQ
jgi:hypothetical protein